MWILSEESSLRTSPKILKKAKTGRMRMEAVLQTCGDVNRNKRRYSKQLMMEGITKIDERVREGSFLGELDHPIDTNPVRQVTVLYKESSHQILELGWTNNMLVGVLETTRSNNGILLKNYAEDNIPIGFSFRGMGDLKQTSEGGSIIYDVAPPLHIITWDAVSFPSHQKAKMIKITEGVTQMLHEAAGIVEQNGMICTKEGYCYLPNDFDRMVEQRVILLKEKFEMRKK
jgi:hypothetical protein